MAVIISISEKVIPNPVLAKLKALDKKRDEKMIAEYKKSLVNPKKAVNGKV